VLLCGCPAQVLDCSGRLLSLALPCAVEPGTVLEARQRGLPGGPARTTRARVAWVRARAGDGWVAGCVREPAAMCN
jgi:hypothetical protein